MKIERASLALLSFDKPEVGQCFEDRDGDILIRAECPPCLSIMDSDILGIRLSDGDWFRISPSHIRRVLPDAKVIY